MMLWSEMFLRIEVILRGILRRTLSEENNEVFEQVLVGVLSSLGDIPYASKDFPEEDYSQSIKGDFPLGATFRVNLDNPLRMMERDASVTEPNSPDLSEHEDWLRCAAREPTSLIPIIDGNGVICEYFRLDIICNSRS